MRRTDPRLQIITETIQGLIPGATPAFLSVDVAETLPGKTGARHLWTGTPAGLAEPVFTALFGRPQTGEQQSPLAQAEDAKRRRDIVGEVGTLMDAGADLESAPWYPARPGDMVHLHYEATPTLAAFGETYVIGSAGDGLLTMQLVGHTGPEEDLYVKGMVGCFAAEAIDCPLHDLWFEAGPHRLTIIRDGRVVHDGTARSSRSVAAAGPTAGAMALAAAMRDAEDYLKRGEPELALARLQSATPLPPCGTPGPMPEHADCARPRGHRGACSDNAAYVEPPHECPALPEQLHAVVTVDAKATAVHLAGLYADRDHAVDHASGYAAYREDHSDRYVKPAPGLPGEAMLELPRESELQAVGVQLAVVVPLPVLPDPRAEDEYAAEGMDYADAYDDDYRDLDE
ncbi:hypothetical protein [Streptomyces hirsutus]|uniref:hypothetical protein n=1 Tax=Streptomyces hirsutus TaxID=35620 RepID=UPI003689255F